MDLGMEGSCGTHVPDRAAFHEPGQPVTAREYLIGALGVKSTLAIHLALVQTHSIQSSAFDPPRKFPPGAYWDAQAF
jgi:hypothetical protein